MKPTSLLLTTAAVVACGISFCQAQDAPANPAPQGQRGAGDPAARAEEYFKRLDTNGDGKVSKEEYVEAAKKEAEQRFEALDANHDGFIDKEELQKALQARGGRFGGGAAGRPRGEGGGERPAGAPEGGPRAGGGGGLGGGIFELIRKVQETGSVTKEDFHKMTDEQFDRLDTNHDGKITKDEIEGLMSRFGRGRRGAEGGTEGGGTRPRPEAEAPKPNN